MTRELSDEIEINAPADEVWKILGERYSEIGKWATVIKKSEAMPHVATPEGADAGGRSCTPLMPFVSHVNEELTRFIPEERTFNYKATAGLPGFITNAENTWSVHPEGKDRCRVKSTGRLTLKPFPGKLIYPFFKWQLDRAGAQLFEELKFYAENGKPHPRKLKTLAKT